MVKKRRGRQGRMGRRDNGSKETEGGTEVRN